MQLDHLLYLCRNNEASNPQDKVYAILGLIKVSMKKQHGSSARAGEITKYKHEQNITDIHLPIVDYIKTVAQVYIDTAHFSITRQTYDTKSLEVLAMVVGRYGDEIVDLPSWVPNFTQLPENTLQGHSSPDQPPSFRAAGETKFKTPQPALNASTLFVEGLLFQTIRGISRPTPESANIKGYPEWISLALEFDSPYPTGKY